jgi:hypothetical protein
MRVTPLCTSQREKTTTALMLHATIRYIITQEQQHPPADAIARVEVACGLL